MSLLDQNYELSNLKSTDFEVFKLKSSATNLYSNLYEGVLNATKLFWDNPNFSPSELASAVGTDGAELFNLHSSAILALESARPGSTHQILSYIKPYNINEDGTITIL